MASTYLSPFNQLIIRPSLSIKPFLSSKTYSSNPKFINLPSLLNSNNFSARITNIASKLNNGDDQSNDLLVDLEEELMPKHIAMIVDGNRRWAVQRGLSGMLGHTAGRMTLMPLLQICRKLEIKVVSLFVFSTENWHRPTKEVECLMKVVEDLLRINGEELVSVGCRVSVMGNKTKLSDTLQKLSAELEEKSRANSGTDVNFAVNYSGKLDVIQACQSIGIKVNDGVILPNEINESLFKQELNTKVFDFPYPDLVIRTGGEVRLSNFMLWQMAYSKLYFVKKYFPDFGENDLIEALLAFQETQI